MARRREPRNLNIGRWLVWAGLLGLLASFWVPWAVAQRTARTEERADRLAQVLLTVGSAMQPIGLDDRQALLTIVLARVQLLAATVAVFADDLEPIEDIPPPGVIGTFGNKHYLFQLAFSPPPDPRRLRADSPLPPPLEVTAWPRDAAGPAHAVFFAAEVADAAFTRNLQAGYVGIDPRRRPLPGRGHRRDDDPRAGQTSSYRGGDDERWLLRHAARDDGMP